MQISIVGTGNVAQFLAITLEQKGHQINEICSRDTHKAKALASKLYTANGVQGYDLSKSKSQIFILAINDSAFSHVLKDLAVPFEKAIVVHTSGTLPLSTLNVLPCPTGVFYPLQTFTIGRTPNVETIPFCLEASDTETLEKLETLASTLSDAVYQVNEKERKLIHLSAVFASNFSNYLISVSEQILDQENINFKILKPLVLETMEKAFAIGPVLGQTGPARRGNLQILEEHKTLLNDFPEMRKIYEIFSAQILAKYNHQT